MTEFMQVSDPSPIVHDTEIDDETMVYVSAKDLRFFARTQQSVGAAKLRTALLPKFTEQGRNKIGSTLIDTRTP